MRAAVSEKLPGSIGLRSVRQDSKRYTPPSFHPDDACPETLQWLK
jgi:hypothetical protein